MLILIDIWRFVYCWRAIKRLLLFNKTRPQKAPVCVLKALRNQRGKVMPWKRAAERRLFECIFALGSLDLFASGIHTKVYNRFEGRRAPNMKPGAAQRLWNRTQTKHNSCRLPACTREPAPWKIDRAGLRSQSERRAGQFGKWPLDNNLARKW